MNPRRIDDVERVDPRPARRTNRLATKAGSLQRRHDAQREHAGATEHRGQPEDHEIELDLFQARQIARCHADESRQQDAARGGTKHTTGNNEEPVLDQKLAYQSPPAAADGRSNAELLSARRTLVQQQRCEIDARDQQQQRDRTGEHGHRRRDLTDDAIGERHQVHGTRRVVLRIFLRQCRLDRLHFGPRGRRCHVWLQSTDRKQRRPRAAALHPAIVRGHLRLEEHVDVRRCQVAKSWRQHADDRERIAVEHHRSTDRFGLAAKLAHPERVADNDGPGGTGASVGGIEEPAAEG